MDSNFSNVAAQLNFSSGKMIAALYLPHNLVFNNAELMMRREDRLKETVARTESLLISVPVMSCRFIFLH